MTVLMTNLFRKMAAHATAVAGLTLLVGCSSSSQELARARAIGVVRVDQGPLEQGTIRFVPIDGTKGPMTTATISEGMFDIPAEYGPLIGKHRVEIEATDPNGFAPDDEEAAQKWIAMGRPRLAGIRIPLVYNQKSTLRAEILPGDENWMEFDLVVNDSQARK